VSVVENRAYLVANDNPGPAGFVQGRPNYDFKTEIVACARYMVPVFWLSGFSPRHIVEHPMHDILGDHRVPALVAETSVVKALVAERHAMLARVFSQFAAHLEEWKQLVDGIPCKYLKLDATQIWEFDRNTYIARFPAAIRWFESQAPGDLDQLLAIADMGYDSRRREFKVGANDRVAGRHLRGFQWERPVPWQEVSRLRQLRDALGGLWSRS
jgi:hypothetical protein